MKKINFQVRRKRLGLFRQERNKRGLDRGIEYNKQYRKIKPGVGSYLPFLITQNEGISNEIARQQI